MRRVTTAQNVRKGESTMAYEYLIADCITREFQGEDRNASAECWADSIVRAELAGFLLENVDVTDTEAVAAEVSNYISGLADMNLDDIEERLDNSTGKEEEAMSLALARLAAIKLAAQQGRIEETKVLNLVVKEIAEIAD
jgi:hypothetical protein